MTQSRVTDMTDAMRTSAVAAATWRSTTTNPAPAFAKATAATYAAFTYAYVANHATKHSGRGTWRPIE